MTGDAIEEKKSDDKKEKKLRERNASDKEWKTAKKKKGTPSKIVEIFYNVFFFLRIKTFKPLRRNVICRYSAILNWR